MVRNNRNGDHETGTWGEKVTSRKGELIGFDGNWGLIPRRFMGPNKYWSQKMRKKNENYKTAKQA